jgi:hypothetical protein
VKTSLSYKEDETMPELACEQVDKNYEAFLAKLPSLLKEQPGKFALMRDKEIVEFFDTARDADAAGRKLFPDNTFSIQQVIDMPVDLGFFSYAMHQRPIQCSDRSSD